MADYIDSLDESYPDGSVHKVFVIDDDQRNTKLLIKNTFPNVTGEVAASHTEINYLDGVTENVQTQIDTQSARIATELAKGTIYAGRINQAGDGIQLPSGWGSSRAETGWYSVTYPTMDGVSVDCIVDAASSTEYWKLAAHLVTMSSDGFSVYIVDVTTGIRQNAGFYFHLRGDS